MKKMLTMLMCLLLAVTMCAPALAADIDILSRSMLGEETYAAPVSMTVVDDTLYVLLETAGSLRLAWWQEGMEEAEMAETVMENSRYLMADMEVTDENRYAASYLFTDGGRVMSLNPFTGLVFAMEVQEGEIVYTDVVTLKDTKQLYNVMDEEYSYLRNVADVVAMDGTLYWLTRDWNDAGKEEIILSAFDLTTGEGRTVPVEHVVGITPYKDGKLLAVIHDQEHAWDEKTGEIINPDLAVMDPADGKVEIKCKMPVSNADNIVYSDQLDAVLFFDNSRIMGVKGFAEVKQYGYAALNYAEHVQLLGDNIILSTFDGTVVRTLKADYDTDQQLNMYNAWLDDGIKLFAAKHPDVPVYFSNEYYDTTEKLNQAMLSGEDAMDLLQMDIAHSSFLTLKEKGYCADLSGDAELMAMAERLHPLFRDAVMQDGKLVAVPVSAYSFGWIYNPEVLEEMGLDESFIPTDFIGLCELVTEWNDGMMDDYPEYMLLESVTNTREWLFNRMMDSYMIWCTAQEGEITFDTPVFRQMMEALENVRCEEMDRVYRQDEMSGDMYRMGLISWGYQLVGDFSWLMDGYNSWMKIIPMQMTPDTPFFTDVQVQVCFINPRTERMELAVELLKCRLAALDENVQHTFFVDETEPVENEYYQQAMDEYQTAIDMYETQLATADEAEKEFIQDTIDSYREMMKEQETYRYTISPESMVRFREEVVPAMVLSVPTLYNSEQGGGESELIQLMNRYRDGQIKLDQFIREADQKLWMMRMENQ